jgi:hypothetical protein
MILTSGRTLQVFLNKEGTKTLDSRVLALVMAAAPAMFFLGALPFFSSLWKPDLIAVACGVVGGISMQLAARYMLDTRKESNSAAMFIGFIALGIVAPLNFVLLGENLTANQLIACIVMGLLGGAFFLYGAASELSNAGKRAFMLSLLSLIVYTFLTRVIIMRTNWYMVGVMVYAVSTLFALYSIKAKRLSLGSSFAQPILWYCGAIQVVMSVIIQYSKGEVLGVSMTHLFIHLSAPITMVLSSYIYKERSPREQLLFGVLAFLIALPLII